MFNPGDTIQKYSIIKELGNGRFGTVYHVHDAALGAEKAIKILDVADPAQMKEILEAL